MFSVTAPMHSTAFGIKASSTNYRASELKVSSYNGLALIFKKRCPQVIVNGSKSFVSELHAGVPQGSILGPLLLIIYTNDIVDRVQINIRLYTDDS